jgi:hypothetical protein
MKIKFEKNKRLQHRAFLYDPIHNYNLGICLDRNYFSSDEVEKIQNYLIRYFNEFKEKVKPVKDSNWKFYYYVEFDNVQDEAFFLVLTSDGIEI